MQQNLRAQLLLLHTGACMQSLFYHVQGLKAIDGVEPYIKHNQGVFVTASGTGFYEQCFPSNRFVQECLCSQLVAGQVQDLHKE